MIFHILKQERGTERFLVHLCDVREFELPIHLSTDTQQITLLFAGCNKITKIVHIGSFFECRSQPSSSQQEGPAGGFLGSREND
jgi:hypothetical protein